MMISLAASASSIAWWYVTLGLLVLLVVVIELHRYERERLEQRCDRFRAQRDRLLSGGSEGDGKVKRFIVVGGASDADIEALMDAQDGVIYPTGAKIDQQWKGIRCDPPTPSSSPSSSPPSTAPASPPSSGPQEPARR